MKRHLIDLHVHSNFSDGKLSISEVVDLYGSNGFSAVAITDHLADTSTIAGTVARKLKLSLNERSLDQYLQTISTEAKRAKEKYDMLLIPGIEVTLNSWSRQHGAHIVFLGVDRYINPDSDVFGILDQNKDFFSIAAHPLWEESYEFKTTYLWENRDQLANKFHAWEAATAQKLSKEVYLSGLPVVFSSDFHGPTKFGSWKSQAFLEELSTDCLYANILARHIEPIWL